MAKIVFSLAGEGRGHATRVRTVVDDLCRDHQLILLAPSVAYDLLSEAYHDAADVTVLRIPGLQFRYRGQRLSYLKSLWEALPYLCQLPASVARVEALLQRERPDLAITDFEPILPRAAERCKIPYISFDHQHFLVVNDLSRLPWRLRWRAGILRLTIGRFYRRQCRTIVSSFYRPPVRQGCRNVVLTGVLLRRQILDARPVVGNHLLVYMRRFLGPSLLDALLACGRPVRLYGLGRLPAQENICYFDIDEENFLEDLVTCDAVVSNAGNQLVGEALYLQKPMLALPEPGNFEQAINGHFLRESGAGDSIAPERLNARCLQDFLRQLPRYRQQILPEAVLGNRQALQVIREEIGRIEAARPAHRTFRVA